MVKTDFLFAYFGTGQVTWIWDGETLNSCEIISCLEHYTLGV